MERAAQAETTEQHPFYPVDSWDSSGGVRTVHKGCGYVDDRSARALNDKSLSEQHLAMVLSINPGIVAAVVILAVELVIIIVVIGFLICKGRKDTRQTKIVSDVGENGDYKLKQNESYESVEENQLCVVESEIQEEKPKLSDSSPDISLEDEKDTNDSTSFISNGSKKKDEEDPDSIKDTLSQSDTLLMKEDPEIKADEELSQNQNASSLKSSLSSSSSSSSLSSSTSSSSSSSAASSSENVSSNLTTADIENKNISKDLFVVENEESMAQSKKIDDNDDQLSPESSEAQLKEEIRVVDIKAPTSFKETISEAGLDTSNQLASSEGVTLSLRIERTSSGTVLRVNDDQSQKRLSVATETSSDSEFDYATYEYDDKIKVIRRYELPPDEAILYSGEARVEEKISFDGFDASEYDVDDGARNEEETVAGIINVTSGEKLTICQAVKNGLIPRKTALLLLEAQAATGSVVNPRNGVKLTVVDAIALGIVDEDYRQKLVAAEGAFYGYMDPRTGESISLSAAMSRKIFPRGQGLRLLEAQIATGGIINPWTGLRYSINSAVAVGLLDPKTANLIRNRAKQTSFLDPSTQKRLGYSDLLSKCTRDLDTGLKFLYIEEKPKKVETRYQPELLTFRTAFRRKVTLQELIEAGIVEPSTLDAFQNGQITTDELRDILHPYLIGENPIAGILNRSTKKVRTICQAVQEGILGRGTAIELLEAQVATGNLIDPFSGKKMTLSKAFGVGLVDHQFNTYLKKASQAVHGYTEPGTNRTISIFEAMKKGIVIENHGIRMLEAQIATGGVVDPEGGYRIPIGVALEKGLFDDRMAQILMSSNHDMKGYYDPNTGDNLNYGELMRRCVRNKKKYGNMLLLPVHDKMPVTSVSSSKLNGDFKRS